MSGEVLDAIVIEDVNRIGTPQGPAAVFRQIQCPSPHYAGYLHSAGLDAWRDSKNAMHKAGVTIGGDENWFAGYLRIAGWHRNAAHSINARKKFESLADPFFPKASGKETFLNSLSYDIARFAGAANTRELHIELSADHIAAQGEKPVYVFDRSRQIQGHIQLAGSSLLLTPPQYYSAHIWKRALANELTSTDHFTLMCQTRASQSGDMIAWQGRHGLHPVLTAHNPYNGEFRLTLRLRPTGEHAAHVLTPFVTERFTDWRRTKGFKHA